MSTGRGETGNVVAALCSFFIPGLGQLIQGRLMKALLFFVVVGVCYGLGFLLIPIVPGVLVHLWCIYDAAVYR